MRSAGSDYNDADAGADADANTCARAGSGGYAGSGGNILAGGEGGAISASGDGGAISVVGGDISSGATVSTASGDGAISAGGAVSTASGLLLIGGGGHALSVIEVLCANMAAGTKPSCIPAGAVYEKIGILDTAEKTGAALLGIPIIGTDGDMGRLRGEYTHAFISLGSIGNWKPRERLYKLASGHGYTIPNIIHPKAYLSRHSTYASGIFAGIGACVNAGCEISEMCILNTGCIVEHGCSVGAYANIAPCAVICGNARIGAGTHIGAGSTVIQGVKIGDNSIIGAGSVVVRDIPDHVVAYGNPCRVIRPNTNTNDNRRGGIPRQLC